MQHSKHAWQLNLLALVSGLLVGISGVPVPTYVFFFAFVPLWLSWLADPHPVRVFFRGWLVQFLFSLVALHWIAYTLNQYGHFSWVVSVLGLCVYGALGNLYIPLAGLTWALLYKKIKLTSVQSLILLTTLSYLYETYFPAVFPWNVGYFWLWSNIPAYQWADYIGVNGLSLITFIINAIITFLWLKQRAGKPYLKLAGTFLSIFLLFQLSGYWHGLNIKSAKKPLTLKVLIIQANIGNNEKLLSEKTLAQKENVINTYLKLTTEAVSVYPDSDLIVWPESALPIIVEQDRDADMQRITHFVRQINKNLLTGIYYREDAKTYNAAILINAKGEIVGKYLKKYLLAFGEFIPGASFFPALQKMVPEISNFAAGPGPTVLTLGPYRIGMQICYESLIANYSRLLSMKNANVIVNLTNDSWFGGMPESGQNLYGAVGRSVESRLPLIRATNTGISTVIEKDGSYTDHSPFGKVWYHQYVVNIPEQNPDTFYVHYGYRLPSGILLLTLSWIILELIRARLKYKCKRRQK